MITVVRGATTKPIASAALAEVLSGVEGLDGQLMIGYPIISTADGPYPVEAVFMSPEHGLVVFDLVEGGDLADYEARQDAAAARLQQRLLAYPALLSRRELRVTINSLTFAPGVPDLGGDAVDDVYYLANEATLADTLSRIRATDRSSELCDRTLSALQNISTVRKSRAPRSAVEGSRGDRLSGLENSIATLDRLQFAAVVETVDDVQRIRGLAGSGKTIVLALKAAYLHAQHPDWRIAVTFNSRSLKNQFRQLITTFCVESTGDLPDWDRLRIVNSWGAPGAPDRSGLYYEYCARNDIEYFNFQRAQQEFGREDPFGGACARALSSTPLQPAAAYNAILVDEAQDLPAPFLQMAYWMLDNTHRLVYAYDELQKLSGPALPPPEEIFGRDERGLPRVSFPNSGSNAARRDIILEKCYRNSLPVLVSAHALGFGIYRQPPTPGASGLIQMFERPALWTEVGYTPTAGALALGSRVVLARTDESSPTFLVEKLEEPVTELITFTRFDTKTDQDRWVAEQIIANLDTDNLLHTDVMVINTDPVTTRANLGPIRALLLDRGISSHIAGVDTSADDFYVPDGKQSVTFTGIFRAKGNEAAMVYVVNAEECQTSSTGNLAHIRNRLFTAITRSKAWVRITGVGPQMDALVQEFARVRDAHYTLDFTYPDATQLQQLAVAARDEPPTIGAEDQSVADFLAGVESGHIRVDPQLRQRLRNALNRRNS